MYLLRKQKISARIFFVLKNSDIKKKNGKYQKVKKQKQTLDKYPQKLCDLQNVSVLSELLHQATHPAPRKTIHTSISKCLGGKGWIQSFKLNRKEPEKEISDGAKNEEGKKAGRKQEALMLTTGSRSSRQGERDTVLCVCGRRLIHHKAI